MPEITPPEELPHAPEFLKDDKWFDVQVDDDLLDFAKPYRPPRYTMERNGIPFADVGELHIISGKPGNGKTGLISQLMATVLCGQFGNTLKREVKHKVRNTETDEVTEEDVPTVMLYIDTEQGEDDTIAIKNRVCSLAGIDYRKPNPSFFVLRLRDTEEAKDRWKKILKAIWQIRPTDIFLDGLLDIVKDYNDQVECQPIIRKCMKLATHYDASLWAVLHENPMVDKLVGVLGSITQRKVAEIFTVIKVKQCDLKPNERRADLPEIYFRVKQNKARGRDVADWLFGYEKNADGWGMPIELDDNGEKIINPEETAIKESIERFKDLNWTSSGVAYNDLDKHLTKQGVISGPKRSQFINQALDCQVITSTGSKGHRKFFFNGTQAIQTDNQEPLPFDQPDENDAPF